MEHRVAIVGMGGITAFGDSWEQVRGGLLSGQNAVRYMSEWDNISGLLTRLGAPAPSPELPEHYTRKRIRSMSEVSLFAVRATEKALEQAGLLDDPMLRDGSTGVAFGSSSGGAQAIADIGSILSSNSTSEITSTTYVKLMPHTTAVNVSLFFGVKGRIIPTSSACTSGSQAVGYAYESIRNGYQIAMIAGGAEEMSPGASAVFDTLYATSQKNDSPKKTPAPFDRDRDGLVIGSGAGTIILEEYEHAKARGARIYCEIAGYGLSGDAYNITAPSVDGPARCMRMALEHAGMKPADIDYLNAHGTSTPIGDANECKAVMEVFGEDAKKLVMSSTKSMTGHLLGGAGGIEAVFTVLAIRDQVVPPTINVENQDPACPIDCCPNEARRMPVRAAMKNSFGFGGTNATIIFKKMD